MENIRENGRSKRFLIEWISERHWWLVKVFLAFLLVESSADDDIYYVYGHGLISEHKGDNVNTYHFDYRGSTVAMTNQFGTVIGEAEYDEYGVVLKSTIVTRYMYNG